MKLNRKLKAGNVFAGEFIINVFLIAGLIGFSIFSVPVFADDARTGPQAGLKPLDEKGNMQISSRDRCPVCAMRVAKYRKFATAIQLTDGRTFYFCGSGCMIRSWLHPEIFLAATKADLKRAVVQDYFTGEQVPGRSVYWVAGSDVIGPMGPAMVPIKTKQHLNVFQKRHGAKAIFHLSEMTDEKWQQLTGKKATSW